MATRASDPTPRPTPRRGNSRSSLRLAPTRDTAARGIRPARAPPVARQGSTIDLGHNLALQVVGEGVEATNTLERLSESDCDVAQGFLLARPMPEASLRQWLSRTHLPQL
jgi:hypothetical protein